MMGQGDKRSHGRYSRGKGTQRKRLLGKTGKGILGRRNSLCKGSTRGTLPAVGCHRRMVEETFRGRKGVYS